MSTLPPPVAPPMAPEIEVVPEPTASNGKRVALIIVLVVGICAIGAAIYAVATGGSAAALNGSTAPVLFTPKPTTVNVQYSVTITDTTCYDVRNEFGYDDIPNSEAEIFDGSGDLLGFGMLDSGSSTGDGCYFVASFDIKPSSDGMYRATVGNNNRGFLNYVESDILGGALFVDAVLG